VASIHDLSALEQAAAVRRRELSPVEIVDHYLDRAERLNLQVGAYITVTAERARQEATLAEKRVVEAPDALPPLHGVPVPVKDLNMVEGVRTTLGSAAYRDLVGFHDDAVVARLRSAGTILLGKTNTCEFGLSCYTENDVAGPARTPWDLSRSAGGSSGGAAAAVAAGLAPLAQGSDGGGSIRIPASACGLFGLKPSRGRISQGPLVPDLAGLATTGPIARTVRDAALALDVMACSLPGDMYSAPPLAPGDSFLAAADRAPGRLRVARSVETPVEGVEIHPECMAAFEGASALLEELGHEVVELPSGLFGPELMPLFETLWSVLAALTPVAPEREPSLRPLTRWLRERGGRVGGVELFRAQAAIQNVLRRAASVLDGFDAILHPTLALPPVPVGYFAAHEPAVDFDLQKRFTPFTSIYNVSGRPAVSVPLHWSSDGLPIGVMLAGRVGGESTLISLSAQLEAARPWITRHPAIW
jgi:amidase